MKEKILNFFNRKEAYYEPELNELEIHKKEVKKEPKDYEKLRRLAIEKFKTRRSIRKYNNEQEVPWKIIYEILEAATNAPCAGNIQNYHIVVITDPNKKQEIAKIQSQQYWLSEAPYLIAVVRKDDKLLEVFPENGAKYSLQNTSALIENIIMLAHFYDLGSCWVESCDNEVIREFLEAPPGSKIDAIIAIGYANESPKVQKSPMTAILKFESFSNTKREFKY